MAKTKTPKLPPELAALRDLPIDQRAEALVSIFRFVTGEFAALVLEHTKPPEKPKRGAFSKPGAIAMICDVTRRQRQPNATEFRALIRAFEALGLDADEMRHACGNIDMLDRNGDLFNKELRQLAPWGKR